MPSNRKSEDNTHDDISSFFRDKKQENNDIEIPWCHGFYKVYYNIRRLFYSPLKPIRTKDDINLIAQVNTLLQTEQSSDKETISKCAQLIALHRHMENTSARKRLEKWAKYVITIYLLIVLTILLVHGNVFNSWNIYMNLDNSVVIVLLSTTTINIIGLGLIVLRGHFEQSKSEKKEQKDIEESK